MSGFFNLSCSASFLEDSRLVSFKIKLKSGEAGPAKKFESPPIKSFLNWNSFLLFSSVSSSGLSGFKKFFNPFIKFKFISF